MKEYTRKKYALKNRVIFWTGAVLLWGICAQTLIIAEVTQESVLSGSAKFVFAAGMLLWFLLLVITWKNGIYRPLRSIYRKITLFNEGIILEEVFDSLKGVSREMDRMISKMEIMLDKDRRIENAKQQAHYLALQNQINPHFLYNVLESMRSDALLAGIPEVAKIAEALSVFFRYTTSKMENLSTLQEELGNVETYFMIQKYRFEDKINLMIKGTNEDEALLHTAIPKLTLQPIVENAIKHGLEPKLEGGTVEISIERSYRNLYISIADDGVGIGEDKLADLNQKLVRVDMVEESVNKNGKGGIALLNVNSRIKLLMGEEYGVHIFSTPGIGTEVRLTFPLLLKQENRGNGTE